MYDTFVAFCVDRAFNCALFSFMRNEILSKSNNGENGFAIDTKDA